MTDQKKSLQRNSFIQTYQKQNSKDLTAVVSQPNANSDFTITQRKIENGIIYYRLISSNSNSSEAKWFSLDQIFPTNDQSSDNKQLEQGFSKNNNRKNRKKSKISFGKESKTLQKRSKFRLKLKKMINLETQKGENFFQEFSESSDNLQKDQNYEGKNKRIKKKKLLRYRKKKIAKPLNRTQYEKRQLFKRTQKYKQKLRQRPISIIDKDEFHISKSKYKQNETIKLDSNTDDKNQNANNNFVNSYIGGNFFGLSKLQFHPDKNLEYKIPRKYKDKQLVITKNGIKLKKKKKYENYTNNSIKTKRQHFITNVKFLSDEKLDNQSEKSNDYQHITRMYQRQNIYYYEILLKDGKKIIIDESTFIKKYGETARKSQSSGQAEAQMQKENIQKDNFYNFFMSLVSEKSNSIEEQKAIEEAFVQSNEIQFIQPQKLKRKIQIKKEQPKQLKNKQIKKQNQSKGQRNKTPVFNENLVSNNRLIQENNTIVLSEDDQVQIIKN